VASLLAATSPGHIEQRRTPLRILAPEFVGAQRRCAPVRQSPTSAGAKSGRGTPRDQEGEPSSPQVAAERSTAALRLYPPQSKTAMPPYPAVISSCIPLDSSAAVRS
jgi:hypothetical protein